MNSGLQGFPRKQPKPNTGGGLPPDGNYTDVTVSGGGSVWTINNNVVTFAKMQQIATDRLLGRSTAGTGNIEELSHDSSLYILGGVVGVVANTTRQLTKVVANGVDVGTRSQMHYSNSTSIGIGWNITDDGTEIDITTSAGSYSVLGNMHLDVIAASTTSYWSIMGGQVTDNTTETNRIVYWPFKGVFRNLYVRMNTAQPATGALRYTLRVATADTSLSVNVAAGSAAGSYSDTSNTASVNQGDAVSMKAQNTATANSGASAFTLGWNATT